MYLRLICSNFIQLLFDKSLKFTSAYLLALTGQGISCIALKEFSVKLMYMTLPESMTLPEIWPTTIFSVKLMHLCTTLLKALPSKLIQMGSSVCKDLVVVVGSGWWQTEVGPTPREKSYPLAGMTIEKGVLLFFLMLQFSAFIAFKKPHLTLEM